MVGLALFPTVLGLKLVMQYTYLLYANQIIGCGHGVGRISSTGTCIFSKSVMTACVIAGNVACINRL
mgnify:FL=1